MEAAPGSELVDQDLSVSGVTALPDDSLLLVGCGGLYRLEGNELAQLLAFAPQDRNGQPVSRANWTPNNVVLLDDGSYVISTGSWRSIYRLHQNDNGQWTCLRAGAGEPVIW